LNMLKYSEPLIELSPKFAGLIGLNQQLENVREDLRRVSIPFLFQVVVDFPVRSGELIPRIRARLADGLMCLVEPVTASFAISEKPVGRSYHTE
jgi:hypothetical protein